MDTVKETLEDKLEAMRGPAMPPDVEARVRQRLQAQTQRHPLAKPRRSLLHASYGQLALLLALLLVAGWVLRHEVAPVLRAAWERAHCLVDPRAKQP